ncbi:MAG: FHA domain-containing protein [Gemmataceae bacterium]
MDDVVLGELVPVGGGDAIPLPRNVMTVGRRESNDICLRFANVSGQHCEFAFKKGVWTVRDLRSVNGVKINGEKINSTEPRPLRPGDSVQISSHKFVIEYHIEEEARGYLQQMLDQGEDILSQSLLEKAGLTKFRDTNDHDD